MSIIGSGRTDSGVHAAGQVANFLTECSIPTPNLRKAIGSRLPKDVSIYHVDEVPLSFRSTSDPKSKLYRYRIYNDAHRPVENHIHRYVYHVWQPLSLAAMQEAARHMVGTHDFAAFASKGSPRETTVRTVMRVEAYAMFQEIRIDVEGSGFLYNQVRNMVGTLLEVGRGHWEPDRVVDILRSCDRANAGPTAPARGLCLQWVRYDLPGSRAADRERSQEALDDDPYRPSWNSGE
jgi:tRNA pseudouridine38-40 synthase